MKRMRNILTAISIMLLLMPTVSFGAVKTIPDSSVMVSNSTILTTGNVNYTATWNGVAGKITTCASGVPALMVPVKSTTSTWTYKDFLDLTFTNAGKIAGRSVDVKMHFNTMTVNKAYSTNSIRDGYMCVAVLWNNFCSISSTLAEGVGYPAPAVYDITVKIVWHGTDEVINLPFFAAASDLDAGNDHYKEGWEAVSGFTGTYYIYKENILTIGENQFTSVATETTGGSDSYLKTGVYAPTQNGLFRMRYSEGNCGTGVYLYNQYNILSNPVKSIQ